MRCFNCGNALPDDSQFCQYCGSDLSKTSHGTETETAVVTVETPPVAVKTEPDVMSTAQEASPRKKKSWLPLLILGFVAVLAIGVFALWSGNNETATPAEAAENVLYLEVYDEADVCIGSGSGFLVNDDVTLVTNYHVIEDAHHMIAMTADGERSVEVDTVIAYDEMSDIAILRCCEKIGVNPLILADSDQIKQGDAVYATRYSLGIANTLSDGIVSSRYIDKNGVDILQITAPISGGSSGGALLNKDSQVVGIICAYYADGQNMNIAIASNAITALLQHDNDTLSLEQFYLSTNGNSHDMPAGCVAVRTISIADEFTAEYILETWKSGEATEDSMIEIMDEYGMEQGGGQLYIIEPGQFVDEIDEWCFDNNRRAGDVAIIENVYGFSICYFSGKAKGNVLTLGTSADFPPFEYYDDTGTMVGMEIELMHAIAEEIGYSLEVSDIPFDDLMTSMINGEINCIASGITETPVRNLAANASIPWYEVTDTTGETTAFVVYIDDEDEDLLAKINKAIKKLLDNGTIDIIVDRYDSNAISGLEDSQTNAPTDSSQITSQPTDNKPASGSEGIAQENSQSSTESTQTAYDFLCKWVSENYNKTLKRSGTEDKVYQEILMDDGTRDTYQIVYCADVNQICLRYIAGNTAGASFTSAIWLEPEGNSFSANFFFYETADATDAVFRGYGDIFAPNLSEDGAYSFSSFDGDATLLDTCQTTAKLMYLESLNFMNYIFYTYATPEGFDYSASDFGFSL
jgi:hypothetical protein